MFGPETFVARMDGDSMTPLIRAREYVYVDPDEPATDGRLSVDRSTSIG